MIHIIESADKNFKTIIVEDFWIAKDSDSCLTTWLSVFLPQMIQNNKVECVNLHRTMLSA